MKSWGFFIMTRDKSLIHNTLSQTSEWPGDTDDLIIVR
jgi:hypothetical protein